jgi:HSP20 family molecular chaperone IbpA
MSLLPFHPFASFFDDALHDSLFFSGNHNNKDYLSSRNNGNSPCSSLHQPLGVRLQQENDKAFVYAIDAPGIQPDEWRLNLEKTKQETIIRLSVVVGQQQKGSSAESFDDRRLFSVGSNVDAESISARLSDHILTITAPKKQKE